MLGTFDIPLNVSEISPKKEAFVTISMIIDKLRKILKSKGLSVLDLFEG